MHIYTWTGCFLEFVFRLQQHLHTTNLRVLFLSIFWRVLLKGLLIYHSHKCIQQFFPKNTAKIHIFKCYEFVSPLQQHSHIPKLRVLFPSIFWRYLLRGLFIYHSHGFYYCTWSICVCRFQLQCIFIHEQTVFLNLFLDFSSTYIHQILDFYFHLYSECFYWRVC